MIKAENSLLILILFSNLPIGVSTSYPLTSDADILSSTYDKFKNENKKPEDYYYYSEVIIEDEHRQKGLTRKAYQVQEDHAKALGFKRLCLATVLRDVNDKRKPLNYPDTDSLWESLGFHKTNIVIEHMWPTLQVDTSLIDQMNQLVFWEKEIS